MLVSYNIRCDVTVVPFALDKHTLYEALNKPEKVEEWRTKLPQTEVVEE
jgi:hypothetical protein